MSDVEPGAQPTEVAAPNDVHPSPCVARFRCLAGVDVGTEFLLDRPSAIIGRDASAHIRLIDRELSRRHARVVRQDAAFVIEDLGSRNGTVVNGHRLRRHVLQSGDRVQCGATLLAFGYTDDLERRVDELRWFQVVSATVGALSHDLEDVIAVLRHNLDVLDRATSPAERVENGSPYRSSATSSAAGDFERATRVADMRRALELLGHTALELGHVGRADVADHNARCELATIVNQVVAEVQPSLPNTAFEIRTSPPLAVRGHAGDVEHVLRSLIANAAEAMPRGGRLRIAGREVHLSRAEAYALHVSVAGPSIELIVADGGIGMDAATRARIFEPSFTTKSVEGAGWGLSTTYGIVRHLGGNVVVSSVPDEGTTVRVLVPAVGNHANDRRIAAAGRHLEQSELHVRSGLDGRGGARAELALARIERRLRRRRL